MAMLGDDCYFFCTSTCTKGAACPFRHVESAKTCRIICQHWQMGCCLRPMCKFRHSDFVFQLDTSEVPCYWETQPTGCVKKNCIYKHLKPRPVDDVASAAAGPVSVDTATAGTAPLRNDTNASQTFIQPVVKPVIIQNIAESEESNSSPVKKPPEVIQEPRVETLPKKQETEMESSENGKVYDDKESRATTEQTVKKKTKKVTSGVKKVKQKLGIQKAQKIITEKMKAKPKKSDDRPHKSVKERLGKVPSPEPVIQSSSESSESGSDSDDSIENIKVMSMEEILRQKALESMMRKRAAERKLSADKKLLSAASRKLSAQQKVSPPAKKFEKHTPPVKRLKYVASLMDSSSSSAESTDEHYTSKQSSEKSLANSSESSAASNSSDSEEDSTEDSEELDVRRVVVDVESEKAARKRAKASFLRKQKMNVLSSKSTGQVTRMAAKNHMPLSALNKDSSKRKQHNKRHIDYDSDDLVSARVKEPLKLNVRDRLGKSTTLHKVSSDARLLSRAEKFSSAVGISKPVPTKKRRIITSKESENSSSDDDRDSLAEVKVKTLEEIRLEKMKKQLAEEDKQKQTAQERETGVQKPLPVKQRLGKIPTEKQNIEDNMKGRQVVLVNDAGSKSDDASNLKMLDEQKKSKKRPWRSQKRNVDPSSTEATTVGDGERTAVIVSPPNEVDNYTAELNIYKDQQNVNESPFEKFKRKTLMKKLQSKMLKEPASLDEANIVEPDPETLKIAEVIEEDSVDVKTLKNKHSHKHHRKVKIERQIYMPPAMKNTVTVPEISQVPEPVSSKREPVTGPTAKVLPLKRGPHPIAAAWTAGLTLSSKGVTNRRSEPTVSPVSSGTVSRPEIGDRLGVRQINITKPKEVIIPKSKEAIASRPKEVNSSFETTNSSVESSGVTIKSFSEIMAEKRKRRMEMLAQKSGNANNSALTISTTSVSSEPLSLPSSTTVSLPTPDESGPTSSQKVDKVDVRPRVPISPIVFAPDKLSSSTTKTTMQADSSFIAPWKVTAQPTIITTRKISPLVPSFNTTSTLSSVPDDTNNTTADKAKVNSIKNSKIHIDKNKKVKKLFAKRNSKEQIDSVISEDSSNIISSPSLHPYIVTSTAPDTVTSTTPTSQEISSHHNQSSKSSSDGLSSYKTSTDSKSSVSPTPQNAVSVGSQHGPNKQSVPKFSTKTDTQTVQPLTRKNSTPTSTADSEFNKKKTHLSVEDEFNFFEDEDLGVSNILVSEDIEPIDDLLQDIDDLLS